MNPEKIYVAIDFKSSFTSVISYAIWLAKTFNCKNICLFHIMEYTLTPPAYLMPYINQEKKKIEKKLNALAEELNKYEINTENKVVFGRLIESIKEVIKDEKACAVIGFKTHITRPSTSERIIKGHTIPVLIVKVKDFKEINPEAINIKKVLCPVDFSPYSLRALTTAKEISDKLHAELKVIHVIPEQKVKGIIEEPSEVEKYLLYLKEEAIEKIKKTDESLQYEVVSGIPSEVIIEKSKDTDLIVIGSKGRSYTEALIIGSVAESVIKNSTKPILLIP
ncbi:MAG: universal stress protein [Thermodesulfovibrio sp.]|jgi:nucleotide-binding universal stress UspA family protein|uniref:universal stress protein n=1 Tax=unclassified Thermodesulfovibrio TaxID=2645936 RepID=UPI00083B15DB|nr:MULTISPECIES: universal stress protein [unclassified Thermodesulfovibrio]MDI1471385.1 universal stress protein [Thermodesulfovibrio sp. 1176]MDI6714588.1 universal stress protein [Thermodesulfovibrio sp.]ODA44338.1 Universal stress protein family [Thermodesulfovibrio sp. N1]